MRYGRVLTLLVAAAFGGLITEFAPHLPALLDHPACVDTIMRAVSTEQPVSGSYECFDRDYQARLARTGIDSDSALATKVGHRGQYHFLGKTADGGYAYEYDERLFPHQSWPIVVTSMHVAWTGVTHGDWSSALIPIQVAWNEAGGKTQLWSSAFLIIYLDEEGKITRIA